jgi:PAS domain S-box-containing protein
LIRLGHRKLFRRKIAEVLEKEKAKSSLKRGNSQKAASDESDSSDVTPTSSNSKSSGKSVSSEYRFKCSFEDETRVITILKSKPRFRDLKKKIENAYSGKFRIKYIDEDGDAITMRSSEDFQEAIDTADGDVIRLKLIARRSSANEVARSEADILDVLLDSCIVIDTSGLIKFMNRASLKMFGYVTPVQHVEQLMPESVAKAHQSFLDRYVETRKARVIGTGREVVALHANGSQFPVHLSVTETLTNRRHTFTAVIRPMEGIGGNRWEAYESLLDAVIVIDMRGLIMYANNKVEALLQYSPAELVGQKVNKIMLPHDARSHDAYLSNYSRTGVAKIIGSGRKVLAQAKNGEVRALNLTVTQQKLGNAEVTFIGLIRIAEEDREQTTLLQVEREVIENLVVPACIIDERGIIQSFNAAASSAFGYSYVEVIGKNVKMLCNAEDRAKHDNYLANYKKTKKGRVIGKGREVVGIRKNGTHFRLHLSINERSDSNITIFTAIMLPLNE